MINFSRKIKQSSEKGQTLLLALLILAAVSATAIGFAILILNLIKGAENLDNSISAFYAAQSGLEKSLYKVKTNRQTGVGLDATLDDLKGITKTNFTKENLEMEMDVDAIDKVEESRTFSLAKDESEQVDFYDPDDPFGGPSDITKIWISWDNNPCAFGQVGVIDYINCYGDGSEWVEISWVGWNQDGDSFENVEKILLDSNALTYYDSCPEESYLSIRCKIEDLDPNPNMVFYRVRIKALYDKVEDIEVKAMNDAYEFIDIPARVHIKTIGKFGRTHQALSASMPWRIPVSGLFDYVIFSEKELRKPPAPY